MNKRTEETPQSVIANVHKAAHSLQRSDVLSFGDLAVQRGLRMLLELEGVL